MNPSPQARLPPGTPGPGVVASFRGAGGRALRYRVVSPTGRPGETPAKTPAGRTLLYLHGIESHGTWFLPAAHDLAARGVTTYLLDRRGSGLNRDVDAGDARDADELLADVAAFRASLGDPSLVLTGLSWGGKLALAAALAEPERTQALVLVTPGLVPRVDLAMPSKLKLLTSLAFGGRARIALPIEPEMFTTDPELLAFIRDDDWRLHDVTARFLMAGRALDRRVASGLPGCTVPVLLFLAGGDRIIDNAGTSELLQSLPRGLLHRHDYDDATHSIQLEQRELMVDDIMAFLEGPAC